MHYSEIKPESWLNLSGWADLGPERVLSVPLTGKSVHAPNFHLLIGSDGRYYAIINSAKYANQSKLIQVNKNGLEIQIIPEYAFKTGHSGPAVAIICTGRDFLPWFCALVREVGRLVLDESIDPVVATNTIIEKWVFFWGNQKDDTPLSRERMIGLIGELIFLRDCSLIERSFASSWTGPKQMEQDFSWQRVKIEVKTTEREEPIHEINGLSQLELGDFQALYLCSICLREVQDAPQGISLPRIIDEIRSLLTEADTPEFYNNLSAAGYQPLHDLFYAKHVFKIRDLKMYKVDEQFPKITHSSFKMPLTNRISKLQYAINCAGLENLSFEDFGSQVIRRLR